MDPASLDPDANEILKYSEQVLGKYLNMDNMESGLRPKKVETRIPKAHVTLKKHTLLSSEDPYNFDGTMYNEDHDDFEMRGSKFETIN